MNTIEAIRTRRSIRKYINKPVPDETVHRIIEAGMYAPSARNYRPWHFIVIRKRETLNHITEVHPYAGMLLEASMAVLVCGDRHLDKEDGYLAVNGAAAIQNMLLASHELGLGSVWMGIYPREDRMKQMSGYFEMPPHIMPVGLVAIGWAAEEKPVPERYEPEKVHHEKW